MSHCIRQTHLSIAETICEATAHAADDLDLRGDCAVHGVGRHGAAAFEVSSDGADFRAEPGRRHDQSAESAVGHNADSLPQGQLD